MIQVLSLFLFLGTLSACDTDFITTSDAKEVVEDVVDLGEAVIDDAQKDKKAQEDGVITPEEQKANEERHTRIKNQTIALILSAIGIFLIFWLARSTEQKQP